MLFQRTEQLPPATWWAGAITISGIALLVLHRFFIDLMISLQQQLPDAMAEYEWISTLVAGCAMALIVPLAGFIAGSTHDDLDPKQLRKRMETGQRLKDAFPPARKIVLLLFGLGLCIGLARYAKVMKGDKPRIEAEYRAKMRKAQALIDKGSDPANIAYAGPNGRRMPTKRWRDEGRRAIKDAEAWRAEELRKLDDRKDLGKGASTAEQIQLVVGPALTEICLAELLAFISMVWAWRRYSPAVVPHGRGGGLDDDDLERGVPAPPVHRGSAEQVSPGHVTTLISGPPTPVASAASHPHQALHDALVGVDLADLAKHSKAAVLGLNVYAGTWRDLPLETPTVFRRPPLPDGGRAPRMKWPSLRRRNGKGHRVFVGTDQAEALWRQVDAERSAAPYQAIPGRRSKLSRRKDFTEPNVVALDPTVRKFG